MFLIKNVFKMLNTNHFISNNSTKRQTKAHAGA